MNINSLVRDWAYKVNDGMPDPKNRNHLEILEATLRNYKYSENFISAYMKSITEVKSDAHKDTDIIKSLGGVNLNQEQINSIGNEDISPIPLSPGSGNTYSTVKSDWSYESLSAELKNNDGKLVITTGSSVKKVRGKFERIAQLNVSKAKNPKPEYLGKILTLYKLSKLSSVQLKKREAAGIKYEVMQADNINSSIGNYLSKGHAPLGLSINGKDTGIKINGTAKVAGTVKADLAFGINNSPNFWMSYKHGDFQDADGTEKKASFQQYGSVSSFYKGKYLKQIQSVPGVSKAIAKFVEDVKTAVGKKGKIYKNVQEIFYEDGKYKLKIRGKKEPIIPKDQNEQIWAKNQSAVKSAQPKNLYVLENGSGWGVKRDVMSIDKKVGYDIAMMSIFGANYHTGQPGQDNVNILMQDSAAFQFGIGWDDEGNASHCDFTVSNKGHIFFNPKLYGGGGKLPTFLKSENYAPQLIARYTGESRMATKDGLMIGVRLLIMPASQGKRYKDL